MVYNCMCSHYDHLGQLMKHSKQDVIDLSDVHGQRGLDNCSSRIAQLDVGYPAWLDDLDNVYLVKSSSLSRHKYFTSDAFIREHKFLGPLFCYLVYFIINPTKLALRYRSERRTLFFKFFPHTFNFHLPLSVQGDINGRRGKWANFDDDVIVGNVVLLEAKDSV